VFVTVNGFIPVAVVVSVVVSGRVCSDDGGFVVADVPFDIVVVVKRTTVFVNNELESNREEVSTDRVLRTEK